MKLSILFAGLVSIGIASAQQAGEQTRKHGLEACLRKTRAPFKTPGSPEYGDLAEPFNLRLHYKPIAIVVPETTEHVQEAVKCAALHRFKVSTHFSFLTWTRGSGVFPFPHMCSRLTRIQGASQKWWPLLRLLQHWRPKRQHGHRPTELPVHHCHWQPFDLRSRHRASSR
jgi:hypothetical protein